MLIPAPRDEGRRISLSQTEITWCPQWVLEQPRLHSKPCLNKTKTKPQIKSSPSIHSQLTNLRKRTDTRTPIRPYRSEGRYSLRATRVLDFRCSSSKFNTCIYTMMHLGTKLPPIPYTLFHHRMCTQCVGVGACVTSGVSLSLSTLLRGLRFEHRLPSLPGQCFTCCVIWLVLARGHFIQSI